MSEFGALQTALSGLLAHSRAMEVIGHNIANANTEGFTRRRVNLQPAGVATSPGVWSRSDRTGDGVDIAGITRMREDFLDLRMRREVGTNGSTEQLGKVMDQIEQLMPEPSDTGIASQLSSFWGAWDDAAAHPGDLSVRAAVLQQADALTRSLNSIATSLGDLRGQLATDATTLVNQVNADSARVAELNGSIVAAGSNGVDTADLQDQRDLIIDRIVAQTGATTRSHDDGTVDVFLGGGTLVRGIHAESLVVVPGATLDPPYAGMGLNKTEVHWALDGYPVDTLSGRIGADLQGINSIVPRFIHQLDGVATQLVTANQTLANGHVGYAIGRPGWAYFAGEYVNNSDQETQVGYGAIWAVYIGDPTNTNEAFGTTHNMNTSASGAGQVYEKISFISPNRAGNLVLFGSDWHGGGAYSGSTYGFVAGVGA